MASNITSTPCNIYRTLSIVIQTPPLIPPANGYTVQWRVVGATTWNIVPNLFGTVLQIPNVPTCYSIEGTIQADCAGGSSNPVSFAVTGNVSSCQTYTLNQNGVYTFTPCGQSAAIQYTATAAPEKVCAITGTLISSVGNTWSSNNQACTIG
jgi:hypothetical protein